MPLQDTTISDLARGLGATGLIFAALFGATRVARTWLKSRSKPPLPPGPRGLPIIGNLLDNTASQPWVVYQKWAEKYGDVIYMSYPNQDVIIVNSAKAAFELLEGKSQIYSDRRQSIMWQLMTWDFNIAVMPYGLRWRSHRKAFHQFFHTGMVAKYHPVQLSEVRNFLRRALNLSDSGNLSQSARLIFAASILRVVYDMRITDMNHQYVLLSQDAVEGFGIAGVPGAFWVEYFPFLRYLPSWTPFAPFMKIANKYRPWVISMRSQPFDEIRKKLMAGETGIGDCVASNFIQTLPKDLTTKQYADQEEIALNVTGIAYAAGADTSNGAAQAFLLGIGMSPEAQVKAQEELDRVVGPNRLPDFDDMDDLPYIQAIILESLRWMPVLPLGVSRMVNEEDEYDGYYIPKGTVAIPNVWAMLHDPEIYPEPKRYNPDRFMKDGKINPDILDPSKMAFGFGRRICPGRHFANNILFITIASILHVFNVVPALDDEGKPIDLSKITAASNSSLSIPENVPCKLVPRSESAIRLIRECETM